MGFDFGNFAEATLNSGVNGFFSWLGAKRQNKWNRENMAYQSDLQKGLMDYSNQIWREQNATQVQNQMDLTRNNPILQKVGMMQAGMNPNGQAGGNVATAPTGTSAPSGSVGMSQASNPFSVQMDLFRSAKELDIMDSQKNLIDTQAYRELMDAEGKGIDNVSKGELNQTQIELNKANKLLAEGKTDEAKAEVYRIYGMTDKEIEKIDAEIDSILNGSWYEKENIELGKGQLKVQQIMSEIEKAKVDLANRQLKERNHPISAV